MTFVNPDIDLDVASFHPGFLDAPDPETLPPGAIPLGRNTLLARVQRPDDGGPRATLRKRHGTRLHIENVLATGRSVDGLFSFERETGQDELLAVCNGILERWDGATDFTAIAGGGVFTPGARVTTLAFKNNLIVMDGHVNLRYDGATAKAIGQEKPTAAPVLSAGPATGPTGTYEGYAVWYDSVMDHESSPSEVSNALAIADTQRQWTKPGGAPAAHYDYWRVYARRTDTGETRFGRVATVLMADVLVIEGVSDTVRQRDLGPLENANDVPPAFAFAEEFLGYRLGFRGDSSDMYASKHLDFQSQHPKDVFPVGGRGDSKPVRSIRKFATECLIRKPTKTYRLEGERVPFGIRGIESSLGGVSQKSGVEIEGWWYDWDEVKGPYRTNTVQWDPLADHRIKTILGTVNKQALHRIECEHHKDLSLVIWKVPVGGSTRCRVLLKFNYALQRWDTPDTGFEYSALAQFTTPSGVYGLYMGDEWGRIYELYRGERDGPPSGTLEATITAATSSSVTAAAAAFFTGGGGLAGMPALVLSPSGEEQWVRIASNTGTVLTLDVANGPELGTVPSGAGWVVIVGGIDWYAWTHVFTAGSPLVSKSAGWFYVYAAVASYSHALKVALRINHTAAILARYSFTFDASGLIWGVGEWGDTWGTGAAVDGRKHRMPQAWKVCQFRFSNFYPDQPIELGRFRLTADWIRKRQVKSGG